MRGITHPQVAGPGRCGEGNARHTHAKFIVKLLRYQLVQPDVTKNLKIDIPRAADHTHASRSPPTRAEDRTLPVKKRQARKVPNKVHAKYGRSTLQHTFDKDTKFPPTAAAGDRTALPTPWRLRDALQRDVPEPGSSTALARS